MNGVNPIEIDKTAEYYNKLQETFKERINTKEELGSMLSNSLGEGDAVKVEISSEGLEMSEEVKRGAMPKGAIRQLEREPLTKEQLRSVPSGRYGEEILSKMVGKYSYDSTNITGSVESVAIKEIAINM